MSIYLVHTPPSGGDRVKAAVGTRFTREGFRWGAFVFGPLWLLWHRLWLELFFFIVAAGLLFIGREFWGLREWAATAIGFAISLFLGFEGASMLEGRLERARYTFSDVVAGANIDDVERRFFARWVGDRAAESAAGARE